MGRRKIHQRIGGLKDAPAVVAEQIQRQATGGETIAWMNDAGEMYATNSADELAIPPHTVIGVYAFGVAKDDIAADVVDALTERRRSWVDE